MRKTSFTGSSVFGIILIAVGVVSLLGALNYFDSWDIFSTYWPLVIVLFGVKHMMDHRSSTTFGLVLILVGAFLQVDQLNLWYFNDINLRELIIPVIIILIGLNFILPKGRNETGEPVPDKGTSEEASRSKAESSYEATGETGEKEAEKPRAAMSDDEAEDAEFIDGSE